MVLAERDCSVGLCLAAAVLVAVLAERGLVPRRLVLSLELFWCVLAMGLGSLCLCTEGVRHLSSWHNDSVDDVP